MPRRSKRAVLLRAYRHLIEYRLAAMKARLLYDINDPQEEDVDFALLARFHQLIQTRYVTPRIQVSRTQRFGYFMTECSERELQRSFRLERYSFDRLVTLISDNTIFERGDSTKNMAPPSAQLLVFLKYIGTLGSDAYIEQLGQTFHVSGGACFDYIERVSCALMELYDDIVRWPTEDSRYKIAERIQADFDFPNCIGLVDGTLLPLAFKPMLKGEDYYTRKGGYAINALLICDDRARVTYALAGWPGSSHDNRVWSNSSVCMKPELHFDNKHYLLGDSAFSPSNCMVPAFKKVPGATTTREREFFNTKLAKIRIRTEHCIGLIKGRFQFFRGIRIVIGKKRHLRRILRLFRCALVLHNLLVRDPLPDELVYDVEAERRRASRQNDVLVAGEDSSECADGDGPRNQLFNYLVEQDGRF